MGPWVMHDLFYKNTFLHNYNVSSTWISLKLAEGLPFVWTVGLHQQLLFTLGHLRLARMLRKTSPRLEHTVVICPCSWIHISYPREWIITSQRSTSEINFIWKGAITALSAWLVSPTCRTWALRTAARMLPLLDLERAIRNFEPTRTRTVKSRTELLYITVEYTHV